MGFCGSCCSSICTFRGIFTIIFLIYAHIIYDVASQTTWFTEQWFAEVWWWTKFIVCFPVWIDLAPIPQHVLKHVHSELKVVNYWVHNDSTAVDRWVHDVHQNRKNDGNILMLRNIWANNTENKLRHLNSIDGLRKYLDLDIEYQAFMVPKDNHYYLERMPLGQVLDQMEDQSEKLTTLSFDYELLETQPWLWQQYNQMWEGVGTSFEKVLNNFNLYRSHSFLYHGNRWRTRLHNAAALDYFLQISNTKRWRFVHKRYIPYLGMYRFGTHTALRTPEYYLSDYPETVPHTEVAVNPGDVMFFNYWHVHEVFNDYPDQLGLAIGIRPMDNVRRLFKEPMRTLFVYNWFIFPQAFLHMLFNAGSYDKQLDYKSNCQSQNGRTVTFSYNGTTVTRYDMGFVNGTCEFRERIPDYQSKELLGKMSVSDWSPKLS